MSTTYHGYDLNDLNEAPWYNREHALHYVNSQAEVYYIDANGVMQAPGAGTTAGIKLCTLIYQTT